MHINIPYNASFLELLETMINPDRLNSFKEVLKNRTRYLTMVSEKSIDYQNVSAMIRTCECLGLQEFHVIEADTSMKMSRFISKGSNKWIDEIRHQYPKNTISDTYEILRNRGYKVAATCLDANSFTPSNIPLEHPLAVVLGTESKGISDEAIQNADYTITIPMYGFTESYNLSVANAIISSELIRRIKNTDKIKWNLENEDAQKLYFDWVVKSTRNIDLHWKRFQKN